MISGFAAAYPTTQEQFATKFRNVTTGDARATDKPDT